MIVRAEPEPAADEVELALLRLGERRLRGVEDSARVGHGLVEEELEEVIAEVVVGRHVLARARSRVPRNPGEAVAHRHERAPQAIEARHLARADAYERHQVVAVPLAGGVGPGQAYAPAQQRGPEAGRAHLDGGVQGRAGGPEHAPALALAHLDPSLLEPREAGRSSGAGDHRAGWAWYGAPFSFSRAAWA